MCQVYGPSAMVGCPKCGAGFYEDSEHTCKKFVPFEVWDAKLQASAKEKYIGTSSLLATLHAATRSVAGWPKWKRHYVWAEEFQHSI